MSEFNITTLDTAADSLLKEHGNLKVQAGAFDICAYYKKARPVLAGVATVLSILPFISGNISKAVSAIIDTMDSACKVN